VVPGGPRIRALRRPELLHIILIKTISGYNREFLAPFSPIPMEECRISGPFWTVVKRLWQCCRPALRRRLRETGFGTYACSAGGRSARPAGVSVVEVIRGPVVDKRRTAMNPMKRLGLVALLVLILGGLFTAPPVLAGRYVGIPLIPPPDSPEPQARGVIISKNPPGVRVECTNLTPRTSYSVCFGWSDGSVIERDPVKTNRKGELNASFSVPHSVLWVENGEGATVLIQGLR
jgi:hypothetical protein